MKYYKLITNDTFFMYLYFPLGTALNKSSIFNGARYAKQIDIILSKNLQIKIKNERI